MYILQIPLGVLLKDESQHSDMISILEHCQQYSPQSPVDYDCLIRILLGGDQFSTAMARRVIADRSNSTNDVDSLKGLQPVVEDWHAELCLLTVSLVSGL